jgi:hypothetical protein
VGKDLIASSVPHFLERIAEVASTVVAPGAYADLLVVEGDPLQDIGVLTDPQHRLKLVMARGRMTVNHLG